MSDEVPIASSAIDAAGGGSKDGRAPSGGAGGPPVYRRRLSNYLLDKRLQLRYVIAVSLLSALICGVLGTLIYRQEQQASTFLEEDLKELTAGDASLRDFQAEVARDMESRDRALVAKMVGAGFGLVLILSVYLLVMTHKVAGPLYKVSLYFDQMSRGRFAKVTPLRRGDMLQDFFSSFQETSEEMRKRMQSDLDVMERAVKAARAAEGGGKSSPELADALTQLESHVVERRKQLADRG